MPTCVVKGCKSGYQCCQEKRHFFKVPKDVTRLEKWREQIENENLKSNSYVCDKHFALEEIIKIRYLLGPDGQVLGVSPLKIPRLQNEAYPTMNLCNSEESTQQPKNSSFQNQQVVGKIENISSIIGSVQKTFTFSDLLKIDVRIPTYWIKFVAPNQEGALRICFSKTEIRTVDGTEKLISLIELIVSSDLHFHVNAIGKLINIKRLGIQSSRISDIHFLQDILIILSSFTICHGYDRKTELDSLTSFTDIMGVKRHDNCKILLIHSDRCDKCKSVEMITNEVPF